MRKWKDRGGIPLKNKKIYAIAIAGTYFLAGMHYLAYGNLSIENIIGLGLASFLIYGIWFGGIYKIARWYAERNARNSDNHWSPDWKK